MFTILTDDEIKKLAVDLKAGIVFTDRHIPEFDPRGLLVVFLPLSFLAEEQRGEWVKNIEEERLGLVYEYLDKAGPRSVNGMPQFFSMRMIDTETATKVFAIYDKLVDAEDQVLEEV